jgi:hypothetical protein
VLSFRVTLDARFSSLRTEPAPTQPNRCLSPNPSLRLLKYGLEEFLEINISASAASMLRSMFRIATLQKVADRAARSATLVVLATALIPLLPILTAAPSTQVAELRGNVTECWAGKSRPVSGLRVYVLTMSESEHVRALLERMQGLSPSDSEFTEKFNQAFAELVSDLKSFHNPSGITKTDARGHFSIAKLRAGERYLVLAIDWDKGDSDELAYYRQLVTQDLPAGITDVPIYMGPGQQSDCGQH